eukprot:4314717-Karenia_brevis.AAC.1
MPGSSSGMQRCQSLDLRKTRSRRSLPTLLSLARPVMTHGVLDSPLLLYISLAGKEDMLSQAACT